MSAPERGESVGKIQRNFWLPVDQDDWLNVESARRTNERRRARVEKPKVAKGAIVEWALHAIGAPPPETAPMPRDLASLNAMPAELDVAAAAEILAAAKSAAAAVRERWPELGDVDASSGEVEQAIGLLGRVVDDLDRARSE